jgi:hypothetical protein
MASLASLAGVVVPGVSELARPFVQLFFVRCISIDPRPLLVAVPT